MKRSVGGRLSTDTAYLKDLVGDIERGEIKVPKFQRRFVWRAEQALDLLDSIANSYPVGSLLFWKTNEKLVSERDIGEFRLPETDDLTPTTYVLDGQQRLTVIYSTLGAPIDNDGFSAGYDLEKEEFLVLPDEPRLSVFPLRLTYQTSEMLNFRTALQAHPQHEELQPRLDSMLEAITGYKLPIVTLKSLEVAEVCPIFERINSSGTRLSTYDLMVAATWSEAFDLDNEAEAIADALKPKGFDDIERSTVLKCLSAVKKQSIKREDVLSLRDLSATEMSDLVEKTREALLKSVDLLSTEFGVYSWDFLPYEALVIVLAHVFASSDTLNDGQIKRAKQWFWRSAFSERYRGASEHYVSRDVSDVQRFIVEDEPEAEAFGGSPDSKVFMTSAFRSNNSRSRAMVLAIASQGPRNLTNGAAIDTTDALSSFNRKHFHHIHPRAHLKRTGEEGEHNCLANICMLSASENLLVSDRDPSNYLPELIARHGNDADAILNSNVMPICEAKVYAGMDFRDFIARRASALAELANNLCEGA